MILGGALWKRRRKQLTWATTVLARLAIDSVRRPTSIESNARAVANMLADEQFDARAPLKALDRPLIDRIYSRPVVLPPLNMQLPGNQCTEGLVFLASLVRALDARTVFEIGTYNGLTAWCMALNAPSATINTLDLPVDATPALDLDPDAGDEGNRIAFPEPAYNRLGLCANVVQHWGDSALFDFSSFGGCCDVVYVDGAHHRAYVKSDTGNALEMVSDRGVIVWDDYWRRIDGVRSVLDSWPDLAIHRVPGTRLAVHFTAGSVEYLSRPEVIIAIAGAHHNV